MRCSPAVRRSPGSPRRPPPRGSPIPSRYWRGPRWRPSGRTVRARTTRRPGLARSDQQATHRGSARAPSARISQGCTGRAPRPVGEPEQQDPERDHGEPVPVRRDPGRHQQARGSIGLGQRACGLRKESCHVDRHVHSGSRWRKQSATPRADPRRRTNGFKNPERARGSTVGAQPQATPSAISASMDTAGTRILDTPMARWPRQGGWLTLAAFGGLGRVNKRCPILHNSLRMFPARSLGPESAGRQSDCRLSLTAVMKSRSRRRADDEHRRLPAERLNQRDRGNRAKQHPEVAGEALDCGRPPEQVARHALLQADRASRLVQRRPGGAEEQEDHGECDVRHEDERSQWGEFENGRRDDRQLRRLVPAFDGSPGAFRAATRLRPRRRASPPPCHGRSVAPRQRPARPARRSPQRRWRCTRRRGNEASDRERRSGSPPTCPECSQPAQTSPRRTPASDAKQRGRDEERAGVDGDQHLRGQ